jgi:hypothetical protein
VQRLRGARVSVWQFGQVQLARSTVLVLVLIAIPPPVVLRHRR